MNTTKCALGTGEARDTCFDPEHVDLIIKYANGNTLSEVKAETNCTTDECLLDKSNVPEDKKKEIARLAFKSFVASHDPNHWLNNTDIDTVMSQLRHQYPGFMHGFIHMIDLKAFPPANIKSFDYEVPSVTEIDFGKEFCHGLLKAGIPITPSIPLDDKPKLTTSKDEPLHSYGVIFNTDSSKGSGQHWFAVFISSDQKNPRDSSKPMILIEIFNSAGGGSTDKRFNAFWYSQATKIQCATGLRCEVKNVSDIVHQSPDTGNCGLYSLFYIRCRLDNVHPKEFDNAKKPITDYAMTKFREVCFRLKKGATDIANLF